MSTDRLRTRELQAEFAARGNPLGWFDALYREAHGDPSAIPWADLADNPLFVAWRDRADFDVRLRSSLVIGCGLGDDAETVAASGGVVTAFDLSPTAIAWCRRRFPASRVSYVVANLLDPPAAWSGAFGFVLEINTLQALPAELRPQAIARVASFVAPGGRLLVICRGRDATDATDATDAAGAAGAGDGPPWPLLRAELDAFVNAGLTPGSFADIQDRPESGVRRFVAEYRRLGPDAAAGIESSG